MVTTFEQAAAIQTKRAIAEKRGYAKAVRRFLKRSDDFKGKKRKLPVHW